MTNFYDFSALDAKNQEVNMSEFKGKVVLVVNVASKCGFTGQYKGLQELHEKFHDQGLEILGFPCNQFGGQEPGTNDEIVEFCSRTYNVSFRIMDKVEVNGDNPHPLFAWLKEQKSQLFMSRIKWNFEKFLIDKDGNVNDRYSSAGSPSSIATSIEKLLKGEEQESASS